MVYFLDIERLLFCFFEFLDSVCIFESVECVLGAAAIGGYVADHDGSAVASEGIFEYHGQFATSEGSMIFILVQCSDALLQGK